MATISLQVAPAKYYSSGYYQHLNQNPHYHDGNAHHALHEIYSLAKQDMEEKFAEPPQKKRRLNDDIVREEDYVVLAKATLELV